MFVRSGPFCATCPSHKDAFIIDFLESKKNIIDFLNICVNDAWMILKISAVPYGVLIHPQ